MSGENLQISLSNLSRYFHGLDVSQVEELLELDLDRVRKKYEAHELQNDNCDSDDECLESVRDPKIYLHLRTAINGYDCADLLQEIYNNASCARQDIAFKEYDSWEYLANVVNKEHYMGFINSLVHLWELDPTSAINRKLSFNAVRTYLFLLTIPGAKSCGVFDEDLVLKCFDIFNFLSLMKSPSMQKKIRHHEQTQIALFLVSLLEDLCKIFKIVSLPEYVDLKRALIKHLKNIILHNHIHGYESIYSYNLTQKSFEVFEILCLPIHGPVFDSIFQIFCITSALYGQKYQNPPARKTHFQLPENSSQRETIMQFFLYIHEKFSTDTNAVFTRFIQSILTNPDENLKNEEYSYLLDIGVKYETEMYKKCNLSIVPWLSNLAYSKEIAHRNNAVEFLGKMLLVNAKVEWTLFENEISQVPREVDILKILFAKIIDVNNGVKQKALGALIKAFNSGNKTVTEILMNAFSKDGQSQYESIAEEIKSLFEKLYHLLNNDLAHIRRAVILLLEILATRNSDMIDCKEFRDVIMELPDDATILVRKQSLTILNTLLQKYPNHAGLIELWTKCFLILMKDSDVKIVELAMNSLKINVFDNIKSYENTTGNSNKMPWEILRSILRYGNRNVLKNAVDEWVKTKALNQNSLTIIESHIYTPNATEAWLLLSLLAKKMKSKNPDTIVQVFMESIQNDMYNSPIILHFILEVIICWIPHFSHHALNQMYSILFDLLKSGSSNPTLVTFIYDVCYSIKTFAKSNNDWIEELNKIAKDYLMSHRDEYLDSYRTVDERFLNYMLIYSDSSTNLPKSPDYEVMHLMVTFINNAAEDKTASPGTSFRGDRNMKLSVTITVLTRLSVRDIEIASAIVPAFARILKSSTNKSIVSNLITCLTDLCKKHTSCVESAMQEVTNKLKADNHEIRAKALRSLRELVMQDYIKMRGRVLLNILTAIVDPYEEISNEASMVVLTFVDEKNKHLLHTCFLESVFVYNGYLQYDGFDLFPVSEFDNEPSSLQGRNKIQQRFSLYQFFIDNIQVVYLMMLLKNLQLIYEQLKKNKFVKCSEGTDTLQDLLHIFRQICEVKAKQDRSKGDSEQQDQENQCKGINAVDTKPVRGVPTMAQAFMVVEKMIQIFPKFDALVRDYDPSLGIFLDRLGEAITANFKQFMEFAQPSSFWQKFKKQSTPKKRSKTGRKRTQSTCSKASDLESIMTEDNDDNASIITEDS
uniref:CSON008800 protein n=1 Tax=Culicoides sonorensis TaxID=179676 RepID=A0A336MX24_CULSO